jgi:gliding motility-associated-like protein
MPNCTSNWLDAGQYVHNGVLQMLANQTCNPNYYYPEFKMLDTLCITPDFRYEVRLRNLNPAPVNLSAYDVYLQIYNSSGINTGVILMDANPTYDWSQVYTRLYAGTSSVGNLASLRPDLNNWTTVALEYRNNILTCYLNGVQSAQVNYSGTICTITGLNITFKGSGEVDWARLLNANNVEVWREDFYGASGCFTPFPDCLNASINPSFTGPTCANNILSLFANSSQPLTNVTWTGPAGFTSTQENPVINSPTAVNNGTYTITGQPGGCGPSVTGSTTVTFTIPKITSNIGDALIDKGDSIQLIASGGSIYSWTPSMNISNSSVSNPFVWPPSTTDYVVKIKDGSCSTSDTVHVTVLDKIMIPNIFSPNGDGVHDRWEIENLNKYPGCIVQIYNPYGQMVRRYLNYDTPWDGKINGRDAPVGTYYYIIDLKRGPKMYTGFVDIIR